MTKKMTFPLNSLSLTLALVLTGCTLGPDFKAPEAPSAAKTTPPESYSYTAAPLQKQTESAPGNAGTAQNLVMAQDIPAQWWTIFHSKELDDLIRLALTQSPNLAAAQGALREAQENYTAVSGSTLYPNVTANLGVQREHVAEVSSGTPGGQLFTLYNASINISYTLDLFGANRRALEGMQASVDYQQFQVEAAYLTLTSNLVTTAIREASLRAQVAASTEILDFQSNQLNVIEKQFAAGAIPMSSVDRCHCPWAATGSTG